MKFTLVDQSDERIIIESAKHGFKDIILNTLNQNVDVKATDICGNTALVYASKFGHKEIFDLLIPYEDRLSMLWRALMEAYKSGQYEISETLIKKIDVDNIQQNQYEEALLYFVEASDAKMVRIFLEADISDIDVYDMYGTPILVYAVRTGNTEIVNLLLENGAEPNTIDEETGNLPLSYAIKNGYVEIVKELINGTQADLANEKSMTPYDLAQKYKEKYPDSSKYAEIFNMLNQ